MLQTWVSVESVRTWRKVLSFVGSMEFYPARILKTMGKWT